MPLAIVILIIATLLTMALIGLILTRRREWYEPGAVNPQRLPQPWERDR